MANLNIQPSISNLIRQQTYESQEQIQSNYVDYLEFKNGKQTQILVSKEVTRSSQQSLSTTVEIIQQNKNISKQQMTKVKKKQPNQISKNINLSKQTKSYRINNSQELISQQNTQRPEIKKNPEKKANNQEQDPKQNNYQKSFRAFQKLLNGQNNHKLYDYSSQQKDKIYQELHKKKYYLIRYLNSGGQANVFEGYLEKDQKNKQEFVFKIYFNATYEEFQKEIEIMKSFEQSINIVKIIDSFQMENIFILVLEKCLYSLQDELELFKQGKLNFSFNKLLKIIFDLFDGLIQFRIYKILHLDIKPHNILKQKFGNYCYSDFGNSFIVKKNEVIKARYFTKYFVSPEQLTNQKSISFKSDVYSLGQTLQRVINVFKQVNEDYLQNNKRIREQIDSFENIIQEHMTVKESSKRLTCQTLHEMFFKLQKEETNWKFLQKYKNKLNKILDLYEFDSKKDIPYFLQLKLFYNLINLDLLENSPKQDLLKNILFYNNIKQQSNIQDMQNDLNNLLKSQETIKYIFQRNYTDIAKSMDSVGSCYINLGDHQNGLKCQLESLNMRKQIFQRNHPQIANSLHNVGVCNINIGDSQDGLKYLLESLEMRKQLFHGNHPQIPISLYNIGQCHMILGDNQTGLKYLLESLNFKKQILQGNHLDIAVLLNYVGQCYINLSDNQSGLKYLLESIEMRKQIFKEKFHLIDSSLNNAGSKYSNLGDNKNGLKYSLEALLIDKQIFLGYYPDISASFKDLGLNNLNLSYLQSSLKYQIDQLQNLKQIFQGNHPDIATFMNNFGSCCIYLGDCQNGLKYLKESLEMFKQIFQGNHPLIATSLNRVGLCYIKLGDNQNGLQCFLESLEMRKQIFKRIHPLIASSLNNVGTCYKNLGETQNALQYQLESLQMFKQIFNVKHPDIAVSMNNVGYIYMDLGNNQNALKYLLESLLMLKQIFQRNHPLIASSLNNVGECYINLGDKQNGQRYKQQSLKISQKPS